MRMIAVVFVLTISSWAFANPFFPIPVTPDPDKTPGDVCSTNDPDFVDRRYPENMTYCERNVSKGDKTAVYKAYKVDIKCKHRYTIDHMVPLSIGGNNSHDNLWPEHVLVKETRERLEQELFEAVSNGEMTSKEAIEIIIGEKTKLNLDLSHVEGCG